MRFIRKIANAAFSIVDHTLVPNWKLSTLDMDQEISNILNKLKIDCVIDVGANKGQYYKYLRETLNYQNLIISIEPIPENTKILHKFEEHDPNLRVYELGLGSERGEKEFNIMKSDELSSFLNPSENPDSAIKPRVSRKLVVKMERLDTLLDEFKSKFDINSLYLKLDTQGYDLEVLSGIAGELSSIKALQTELPLLKIYDGAPTFVESISYLLNNNFYVTGMYPVHRDSNSRIYDLDCVLINGNECSTH